MPNDTNETLVVRVKGISHYQEAASHCRIGDKVTLVPEPDNPYDRNAVRVDCHQRRIGYIARELAPSIKTRVGQASHSAVVSDILGERSAGFNLGVEIRITFDIEPKATDVDIERGNLIRINMQLLQLHDDQTASVSADSGTAIFHCPTGMALGVGLRYPSEAWMNEMTLNLMGRAGALIAELSKIPGYTTRDPDETTLGYHVTMNTNIIQRTAFCTSQRLFEQLVREGTSSDATAIHYSLIHPDCRSGSFEKFYAGRVRSWDRLKALAKENGSDLPWAAVEASYAAYDKWSASRGQSHY